MLFTYFQNFLRLTGKQYMKDVIKCYEKPFLTMSQPQLPNEVNFGQPNILVHVFFDL